MNTMLLPETQKQSCSNRARRSGGGMAMKTEAKNAKYRKEEDNAAFLVRNCKSAIAYYFEKAVDNHNKSIYFFTLHKKTENKFIGDDKYIEYFTHK